MHNRLKQLLAVFLCIAGCTPTLPPPPKPLEAKEEQKSPASFKWGVYYDNERPAEDFAALDLVIFDRRYHPNFRRLGKSTTVLAYVSMGEVYDDVPERKALQLSKSLLAKNITWNSHVVDLTTAQWRTMVMGYVDNALANGFDGVMLDTVDSPLEWARTESPKRYAAMQTAAAEMIHDIRQKYPDIKIMLNRGFDIVALAAPDLDYVLAESILTHKDVSTGQFRQLSPKTYRDSVDVLRVALRSANNIKVMTLDYWDIDDGYGVEEIYRKQRAAGFYPYVTTPDLRNYTPEPLQSASSVVVR